MREIRMVVVSRVIGVKVDGIEYTGFISRSKLRELYSKVMTLIIPAVTRVLGTQL